MALLTLGAVLAMPLATAQQQPARLALLIANQGYAKQVGPLANPHNDIEIVGAALKRIGFEVLPPVKEAKRAQILATVRQFTARLRAAGPGAIGFVYYSGHGAAESDTNTNYLIPIDAPEPGSATFWDEALKLDDLLKVLDSARAAAKFVVFDACRNELAASDKSTTKGFVPVAEQAGMFIAYATAQGRTASDRGQKGGPYSNALAAEIVKPGVHHLDLFQNVKEAVSAATGGAQVPWERNGLARREYLAGVAAAKPAEPPVQPPVPAVSATRLSEAAEAWTLIKDAQSIATLEVFVRRFGDTFYGDLAKARIAELKAAQVAVAPSVVVPKPAPPPKQPTPAVVPPPSRTAPYSHWDCKSDESWCKVSLEMRVLPTGSFMMGSTDAEIAALAKTYGQDCKDEGPQRRVTINHTIAMAKVETTFELWDLCHQEGGCKQKPETSWGRGRQPVHSVSWDEITTEFLPWLNGKLGFAANDPRRYRLPTEAEWEYATRAGTTGDYSFTGPISADKANYDATSSHAGSRKGTYRQRTVAVDDKGFPLNPWGLAHVHGNVWEWVQDCYADSYQDAPTDGSAVEAAGCTSGVLRGGGWISYPQNLRAANRSRFQPDVRSFDFGFRLARTLVSAP